MTQFLRDAKVIIAKNKTRSREIIGLRVSFRIEQSISSNPNPAEIRIWNLKDETIARFKEPETEVYLEAGYEGNIKNISWGNDLEVDTIFEGPDKITIIKSRDGGQQLSDTTLDLKVTPGSDMSIVVQQIFSEMKNIAISPLEIAKLLGKGNFKAGGVLNGTAKEMLQSLLDPLGVRYSIQKGEVKFETKDDVPQQIVTIGPQSGLIGSPQKTKEGLKAKILLNPLVVANGFVSLRSRDLTGIYKVLNLTHIGDTWGKSWETEFEAKTI